MTTNDNPRPCNYQCPRQTNYRSVYITLTTRSRRHRDRMVVGYTTTCTISTYHH